MVEVGTGTVQDKELKRDWPITSGLTAGTQKQEGRQMHLDPEGFNGEKSMVFERNKIGLLE